MTYAYSSLQVVYTSRIVYIYHAIPSLIDGKISIVSLFHRDPNTGSNLSTVGNNRTVRR